MEILNLPGPIARSIVERDRVVISPSYPRVYPFVMDHGKGTQVWDVDNNRFLDFTAGIAVLSTGHSHPNVVKAIQEQAKTLFEGKRGPKPIDAQSEPDRLYGEIGRLKMELDWLKKKSGMSPS